MTSILHEKGPKEEELEKRDGKTSSFLQKHLGAKTRETELRLGLSSCGFEDMGKGGQAENVCGGFILKQRNSGFGAKRCFSETTGDGFANPWRQEKAGFDQSQHQREPAGLQRAPPVVGWPPIRAFRKNLAPHLKPEMETKATTSSVETSKKVAESMFVKVNMEGYAVGRKINLKAHESYESLSRALQMMFNNFFSIDCLTNQDESEEDKIVTPDHVLIYEDNEGDRMLVGDVPWEMFISNVKRLYIISGSNAPALVAVRVAKNQQ